MHTEYEVRILNIDKNEIIEKLNKLNASFEWDALQQRYVYDFIPKIEGKWIRLRTNGLKSTLTIKNLVSSEIDGTQELEIEVDSFERTNLILKELGYVAKGYQENRRIQYLLNGVEIDIDSWPLIPTYLEIEGPSEEAVYNAVSALGFSVSDTTTRDVEGIYLDEFSDKTKVDEYNINSYEYLNDENFKLYEALDKRIMNISSNVKKEFKKLYIAYKVETNFADIIIYKSKLKVLVNMKFNDVVDPLGICTDISNKGSWGNGDIEITYDNINQLDDIMDIIIQSHDSQINGN